MGVDVRRGGKIRMPQPVLNLLEGYAVGKQERCAAMPLRYNYDKPEKPRRIKGFEVFSLIFSSKKSVFFFAFVLMEISPFSVVPEEIP